MLFSFYISPPKQLAQNGLITWCNIFWKKKDNLLDQEMLSHYKDPGILVCGDRSSSVHEYLVNIQGLYCQFQKIRESSYKEGGPKAFFFFP